MQLWRAYTSQNHLVQARRRFPGGTRAHPPNLSAGFLISPLPYLFTPPPLLFLPLHGTSPEPRRTSSVSVDCARCKRRGVGNLRKDQLARTGVDGIPCHASFSACPPPGPRHFLDASLPSPFAHECKIHANCQTIALRFSKECTTSTI